MMMWWGKGMLVVKKSELWMVWPVIIGFCFFFSDEVYLIYNVLLASRIQRNGSVIYIKKKYIYIYIHFH